MNEVVLRNMFHFQDSNEGKMYEDMEEHSMNDEIVRCRCIAGCLLGLRLRLFQRVNTVNKTTSQELDTESVNLSWQVWRMSSGCLI